ncbi:CDP-diacylglycerol--glycerol-3-phosphate 3-phosphatidyltransferase [Arthrobacter sp. H14]|uniref:CDP-diacylglycerol--glycerol-3-phosphate 3-phosphatidyltransferase n=1 Tax=Arthrobacter sp. H14 TaxID=1312959 RepID=UPI000479F80F|nr:CDP-diacylglycerol--glycerol-3-phosphate 3-phosphatidyltransferase [Arthrobacter sp. H14]
MTSPQPEKVPTLNIANVLTVIRVLLVPLFIWLLLLDEGENGVARWLAVLAFAVAIYTDKLDGDIARSRGLITNFGKIADPIADKLLIGSALVLLSVIDGMPWWITIVILGRELFITVLRFVVIRYGVIPASRGGKLKTVLQTAAVLLYLMPLADLLGGWMEWVALAAMLIAVAVTVITGVDYVIQAVRLHSGARGTGQVQR